MSKPITTPRLVSHLVAHLPAADRAAFKELTDRLQEAGGAQHPSITQRSKTCSAANTSKV